MSSKEMEVNPISGVATNFEKEVVQTSEGPVELPRIVDNLEPPEGAVVNTCPLNRGNLTPARRCLRCEHFNGWWQRGVNGQFDLDYAVMCDYPIPRSLNMVK